MSGKRGRKYRDVAPLYQQLADGLPMKAVAANAGITTESLRSNLSRHRLRIKARSMEHALSIMIARGEVVARG